MKIHVLPGGILETNAYLLTSPERGEAVLIDAPDGVWDDVAPLLASDGCRLTELWLTHGHWDHMQDAARIARECGAKIRAHPADRVLLETPAVMSAFLMGRVRLEPVAVDHWLAPGERLTAPDGSAVEVRHVPGHCPGNVLFYLAGTKIAFVGDAIFAGGVGRSDLPGGDGKVLAESIRSQIYTLPDETVLYPGHGPETTVGRERATNPFVRG